MKWPLEIEWVEEPVSLSAEDVARLRATIARLPQPDRAQGAGASALDRFRLRLAERVVGRRILHLGARLRDGK